MKSKFLAACAIVLAASVLARPAQAVTIDFTALPTTSTASLTQANVTVTGSANVTVSFPVGLGILGVINSRVDGTEFIDFAFAVPVENLSYSLSLASCSNGCTNQVRAERTLEVFGVGGGLLGTFTQSDFASDVSALLGGDPLIERFRLTVVEDGSFRLGSVTYDVVASVPGPIAGAGIPGLIIACGGLLALARRRKHATA